MHRLCALLLLLVCCSCNGAGRLSPQKPRISEITPVYRQVAVYFPESAFRNQLIASVDGKSLRTGEVNSDDAVRETIVNSLTTVSGVVTLVDSMLTFAIMKQQDLDAFFWLKDVTVRSSLEREGTLFPSYTSYSSISMKLMRISGFRGTIDSLMLYGSGSYYAHGIGTGRARIAQIGAEIALRDVADKIVLYLTGRSR